MLEDVAAIYRASKKKQDINWFTEWICRPPAALVVFLVRGTPITPNQITFLSAVVCAAACALFVLWLGPAGALVAALVFELSFVLDCADGQLARVRQRASVLGHLLDFLMDEIKAFLVYAAIAARLWRETGNDGFLLVGLAGTVVLASGISITSFMRRPEYGAKPPTADGQPAQLQARQGIAGQALSGFEAAARAVVHYPQYIWLVAALNRLDIYFWAYGAVNLLYLGYTFLALLARLGRFDRSSSPS
jgi:hypothetical protein